VARTQQQPAQPAKVGVLYGRPGGGVSRSYTDLSPAVLDDSHDAADDSAVGQHVKTIRRYVVEVEK
jgi:hypothetical protein